MESRPMTVDEARVELLNEVREIVDYWAQLPGKTAKERCRGVAFSIFAELDGESESLPAVDLVVRPHPDDKEYQKSRGKNWHVDGMVLNETELHHEL